MTATVGPEPESHAAHAEVDSAASSATFEVGAAARRTSWCRRSERRAHHARVARGERAHDECGVSDVVDDVLQWNLRGNRRARLLRRGLRLGNPCDDRRFDSKRCDIDRFARSNFPASIPSRCACAATTPATRAAPEKPSPRPIGILEATHSEPVPPASTKATWAG